MSAATLESSLRPVGASHLVVDLNHTLVRTDTMVELLLRLLFTAPLALLAVLKAAFRGRAAVKAALARLVPLDAALLPYDQSVIELVRAHRAAGGQAHLISGADPSTAEEVAEHLGIFNSVVGRDIPNLNGARRAEYILERFGDDFAYAGDSPTDIPVWKGARQSIIVKRVGRTLIIARRSGVKPSVVIEREPARLKDWVSALRLHQWSKNVIVLAPIALSQQLLDPLEAFRALAAFFLFGVVASGTYLVNDLADLAADRKHPTKRLRPICAGRIPLTHAALAAVLLVGGGLSAAAVLSAPSFWVLAAYTALTLLYSFSLKREMGIDLLVIGVLFLLRVACGMVSIGQPASLWLCSFTVMLFTSLAAAKRHGEVIRAAQENKKLAGRDYVAQDAPLTAALGMAAASSCTLVMLLYMQFEAAGTGLYRHPSWLFVIPIVLASWLLRVWSKAHRGTLHDDPVVFALKDKISWLHGGLVAGLWSAAVVVAS